MGKTSQAAHLTDNWKAALYMRLSKDDDNTQESASIAGQKKLLSVFAEENGYEIIGLYIDDGYSGTSFDRPDFMRMISDIKAKKINMVITKDLSRLGRDYITAGQYTEIFFPEHNVRYIAINDGYDSINEFNDIAPFKHVLNEMYARDTSKKIRSAIKTKMREGSYIGNFAPYGYIKDPENKNRLIIDPESAAVIRKIFKEASAGKRPSEIAELLNSNDIISPSLYRCRVHPHLNPGDYTKRCLWSSSTICKILSNTVYLGHTAQGKTSKPSLKSKSSARIPREEWLVVKNTHEPIIAQDVFDLVRKRSVSRRNEPVTDFRNIFSGIVKCADCGGNMSTAGGKRDSYKLVCGRYKLYGSKACSNHFIDYQVLYNCMLMLIKKLFVLSRTERRRILLALCNKKEKKGGQRGELSDLLKSLSSRDKEIDIIIQRLYEDNINGKISDERFSKLCKTYETEQQEILKRIALISDEGAIETEPEEGEFITRINDLTEINQLTPGILKRMIDKIEISQGFFSGQKVKRQSIKIYWSFNA